MKKLFLILAMLTFASQSAFALAVSAQGSAFIPSGSYKDTFKIGYDYGLSAEQDIIWFLALKAAYHRYHADGKSGYDWYGRSVSKMDGDAVELMLKFAPFDIIVEPYVAAGGGYYSNKIKTNFGNYTQDGFGFVGEAGLNFNFLIMAIGLNAKYIAPHLSGGGQSLTGEAFTAGAVVTVKIPFI